MTQPLFSSDDHIDLRWLPRDLWTSRVPRHLADRAPQVGDSAAGPAWMCEGRNWGVWGTTLSAITGKKWAVEAAEGYREGDLRPTNAPLRLSDMDYDGIQTSVMFGPVTPLGIDDAELRVACYRAYNDWLVEFCSEDSRRLMGVGFLPMENPAEATAELRRLAKTSIRQVNLLFTGTSIPMHEAPWAPLWDAAEETGMILSCHFSTAITKLGQASQASAEPRAVNTLSLVKGWTQFIDPIVGLLANGVLERRPGVKLVLAETGVGWLPFVIDRMDQRFDQVMENKAFWDGHGGVPLKRHPGETFKRQVWLSFADDRPALSLLSFFGEDNIMWASDYPHPDSTFPHSRRIIDKQTAGMLPQLKHKFTFDNASKLYGGRA